MDIVDSEATEPEFMAATKATTDLAAVVAVAFVVAAEVVVVVESDKIRNEIIRQFHRAQIQPISSHGTDHRLINSII